jgi:HlyD family secretion protein
MHILDTSVDPAQFAPALMRAQSAPPPPFVGWMTWTLLLLFACLLAWAVFARLDIVAVAQGKLVPQTYLRIVQPYEQGIVKEILVREGEAVKAGQVLLRMDARLSDADRNVTENDLKTKALQLRRIDAEMAGAQMQRQSGDDTTLFAQVETQFRSRRQAYQDAVDAERAALSKARQELKSALEVEGKLRQALPIHKETAEGWDKLAKEGFAGRLLAQEKVRVYLESAQDLKAQTQNVESLKAAIAQAEKRLAQITSNYRQQLQTERVDTALQAHRLREELVKQEHRTGLLELKAPQAGVVKDLATHTMGTVTASGAILMTLVPANEPLVAEVWVNNDDVGFVRAGQPVKVKLMAFQFQKYGMAEGKVRRVSADASENQQASPASVEITRAKSAAPLTYKTLVEMKSQDLIAQGVKYALAPGMQVAAEIHLGERTVLEYLLSPITKAFHEAGRER